MEVITKNKEDYISFSIKVPVDSYIDKNGEEKDKLIELRFIDSYKFMSSSLDSLTKNLVRGGKKLFGFEDYSYLQYGLLTRKRVYPYEYVNSWDSSNVLHSRALVPWSVEYITTHDFWRKLYSGKIWWNYTFYRIYSALLWSFLQLYFGT